METENSVLSAKKEPVTQFSANCIYREICSQMHLVIEHGENFYQVEWDAMSYLSFLHITCNVLP